MAAPAATKIDHGRSGRGSDLLRSAVHLVPGLLEVPMRWAQRGLGLRRMAWLFLTPNLLIFGLFTFLPIILNFFYATTGGGNILLRDRPRERLGTALYERARRAILGWRYWIDEPGNDVM
jgi:alpha-1,4-digalacturonate transport system permease protein